MTKYAFPVIVALVLLFTNSALAQDNKPLKQGRIVYEQLMKGGKSTVNINGSSQTFDRPDRIQRIELLFTQDQSLRKTMDSEDRPEAEMTTPGMVGGMTGTIRMVSSFMADGVTWYNFTESRKVEQRESVGKKYLIQDSINRYTWKLTGETKTILGYTCQKAITQTTAKAYNMQMQDGEFKRTERIDTINVTVWFAPAIAIPAGPEYQGQLPGLILESESRNGNMSMRAVEISEKVKIADIKEPKTGKKVTQAEFTKEVEEVQKEMMNRGSRPAIRGSF